MEYPVGGDGVIFLYVLCFIAGVVVFYLPGRIFKSKPTTDQVIYRKARKVAGTKMTVEALSVEPVDRVDWAEVRLMEWDIYGKYWHASDGRRYDPSNHEDFYMMTTQETHVRTPLERYDERKNYAPGTNGPWGAGTYVQQDGVHVQLDRADAPYDIRPTDYREQVGSAPWTEALSYHNAPDESPWGDDIASALRAATLNPPTADVVEWSFATTGQGALTKFYALYNGGRSWKATRIGDYWHVDRKH